MNEIFTIKINNGYYVDHGKKFFKRMLFKKIVNEKQGGLFQ